jgi:hypothetical protein
MRFFAVTLLALVGLAAASPAADLAGREQSCPCLSGRELVERLSAPACCYGGHGR